MIPRIIFIDKIEIKKLPSLIKKKLNKTKKKKCKCCIS